MKKGFKLAGWTLVTGYFAVCVFFLSTLNAQAYIDPSAVTYIIQAVAGVLIAIGALLTIFRHKIAAFFKKGKGEEKKAEIHFTDDDSSEKADDTESKA